MISKWTVTRRNVGGRNIEVEVHDLSFGPKSDLANAKLYDGCEYYRIRSSAINYPGKPVHDWLIDFGVSSIEHLEHIHSLIGTLIEAANTEIGEKGGE